MRLLAREWRTCLKPHNEHDAGDAPAGGLAHGPGLRREQLAGQQRGQALHAHVRAEHQHAREEQRRPAQGRPRRGLRPLRRPVQGGETAVVHVGDVDNVGGVRDGGRAAGREGGEREGRDGHGREVDGPAPEPSEQVREEERGDEAHAADHDGREVGLRRSGQRRAI